MNYTKTSSTELEVGDEIATEVKVWCKVTNTTPKVVEGEVHGQWLDLAPVEPVNATEKHYWIGKAVNLVTRRPNGSEKKSATNDELGQLAMCAYIGWIADGRPTDEGELAWQALNEAEREKWERAGLLLYQLGRRST